MGLKRKIVALIMSLITVINFSVIGAIPIFAHESVLDVGYDNCIGLDDGDGIDEKWYVLERNAASFHISHEIDTIRYCFADSDPLTGCTWIPNGESEAIGEEIKAAYARSMEKWNNVYFYSYNSNASITKHRLINLVEVTSGDCELTIYPKIDMNDIAQTGKTGNEYVIETGHTHHSKWEMFVNVNYFYANSPLNDVNEDVVNLLRERTGAHEVGHILGLRDTDIYCNADNISDYHHHEVLMGYGIPLTDRAFNITYKDIAGVTITRGLHTDDDHQWLYMPRQGATDYKLVCWICNGVKYVESLANLPYAMYGCCDNEHELLDGYMWAVASYGNQDYYKCRYCRYVAPFSDIVSQNYIKSQYSDELHKCANDVEGLEYTLYEEHSFEDIVSYDEVLHTKSCECGVHTIEYHVFVNFVFDDSESHRRICECGVYMAEEHTFEIFEPHDGVFHKKVCKCGAHIVEQHSYGDWGPNGSTLHRKICECGACMVEEHTFEIVMPYDSGIHKKVCKCGMYIVQDHLFVNSVSQDYASHKKICECGAYILEEHEYRYVSCYSNDYHLCVCDCGYEQNGGHVVEPTTAKRAPCLLCGAMVTIGNTTILPWGDGEDEELN